MGNSFAQEKFCPDQRGRDEQRLWEDRKAFGVAKENKSIRLLSLLYDEPVLTGGGKRKML